MCNICKVKFGEDIWSCVFIGFWYLFVSINLWCMGINSIIFFGKIFRIFILVIKIIVIFIIFIVINIIICYVIFVFIGFKI